MMVVIVVSRRVGQVTLAVSLRTSCRNLNGLKAIVWSRPVVDRFFPGIQNSPIAPNPHLEGEPQRGLDCPGMKKAAPEIRKRAGSRWRLCTVLAGQGQGVSRAAKSRCPERIENKTRVG
jgi:hypothetical protein